MLSAASPGGPLCTQPPGNQREVKWETKTGLGPGCRGLTLIHVTQASTGGQCWLHWYMSASKAKGRRRGDVLVPPHLQQLLLRGHCGPALKGTNRPGRGWGSFVFSRKTTTVRFQGFESPPSPSSLFQIAAGTGEVATGPQHVGQEPLRAPTQLLLPRPGSSPG